LDDQDSILGKGRYFFLFATAYRMGTGVSFSGGEAAGAWSWPLTSI